MVDDTRTRRHAAIAIGIGLFIAYAYFYQGGGWNQNSRFALVRALVEQQTMRIDDTVYFDGRRITGDLAEYNGHFYSDKPPGLALVAVPVVALTRPLVADPGSRQGIAVLSYIATVVTAGLPTVLAALLVFHLAGVFGASRAASLFGALVFGLASPAWPYATLFFGHALATACLVAAFAAAVALRQPLSQHREQLFAVTVGLGGGWATVTEYAAVFPAAMIALLAIVSAKSNGRASQLRVAAGLTLSALACASVLIGINMLTFGGPFELGYEHEVYFKEVTQGSFGFSLPRLDVLRQLLFGQFRGLFFVAPVLAVAPLGFAALLLGRSTRAAGITVLAISCYFVLLIAAASFWYGGWSFGPRYLAPILPFLSIAVAVAWSRARVLGRVLVCALAVYGGAVTFVAVSTTAQPGDHIARPVTELLWPSFAAGRLSINWQSFVDDQPADRRDVSAHAWNIGEKLGLRGLSSLVPLIASWLLVAAGYFGSNLRRSINYPAAPH